MSQEISERAKQFQSLYDEGLKLLAETKDGEAMAILWKAANAAPEGWLGLAVEMIKDKQWDLAIARLREVLAISKNPKVRAAAYTNIGMVYSNCGQNDKATEAFQSAARESTAFADTYSNLALMAQWRRDYKESLRYCNMALARDPWHEQASFIKSMALLLDGNYEEGWDHYECRWRSKTNKLAKICTNSPEWDGTIGRRVFVYGEQGHGDSILALRYANEIKKRGMWQCWVTQKTMSPLLRHIGVIDHVLEVGDKLPDFDCHIPAVSLPRIFKTRIDSIPKSPYIQKPEPHDYGPGFHVGLCWRGSAAQGNDTFRSTDLMHWIPILTIEGISFHSCQVDNAGEALLYSQIGMEDRPLDWLETAKRLCGLDLVITVDTSIVHICGALGIPCWVAMHCRPYFVYPPSFGEKTPWYESVKLYRQHKELEWEDVFERIANDLRQLIKTVQ